MIELIFIFKGSIICSYKKPPLTDTQEYLSTKELLAKEYNTTPEQIKTALIEER